MTMRQDPGKTWLGVIVIVILTTSLVGCQEKARGPGTASTRPHEAVSAKEETQKPAVESTPKDGSSAEPPKPVPDVSVSEQKPRVDKPVITRMAPLATTQPHQPSQKQATPETSPSAKPTIVEIQKPKRPITVSWVRFREALEPKEDVTCEAAWTGGNRLEITTTNIKRLTLDLTKLPEGTPRKGPWNVRIDGQGIEITGFRPKEGYTGKIRDLVCSENGRWTVDRKALYRGPN